MHKTLRFFCGNCYKELAYDGKVWRCPVHGDIANVENGWLTQREMAAVRAKKKRAKKQSG